MQASNGTYGENSINAIRSEINARVEEISRIKSSAEYNDIHFFEKTQGIDIQVGIDGSDSSRIHIDTALNLDCIDSFDALDITDSSTLDKIDDILSELTSYQVRIGSSQNRLECALEFAEVMNRNITSSLSTIEDADIAKASSDFIKYQILQQACATLLSTANQMPAMALQLL